MYYFTEHNIFIFLVQVFILLGLAKGLGEVFRRFRQPAITAEILVGVLLGPTVFGRAFPSLHRKVFPGDMVQNSMLETVAWLGLLLFLLETGLKMDFSSAWRHRGKALTIALTDIIIPMSLAFGFALLLPSQYLVDPGQRLIFSLFMATVMTISSMPIAVRALSDLNLVKTDLGFLIMSALSVNEVIGWVIFSLILGAVIHTGVTVGGISLLLLVIIGFTVFAFLFGKKFADFVISGIKRYNMPEPASSLSFICLLGFFCGAVYQGIGVHALLGFFIAGAIAGEAASLSEKTRHVISQMVYAIFVPLFFANIGLKVDFLKNFDPLLVFTITFIGMTGKYAGAWLGASFTSLARVNRLPLAIAHTPGGSMEIVIGIIALEYDLINQPIFVAIVFSAVFSSTILGPWLKFSIDRRREVSVLEYISHHDIIPDLEASDKAGAIRELCKVAAKGPNMPHVETIISEVMKREETLGTAMEEGIAIPHARIRMLVRPVMIFGRSIAGIEWNSPDGLPAKCIFMILTPKEEDESQIQILRIIATTMSDAKNREAVIAAQGQKELWDVLKNAFISYQIIKGQERSRADASK